MHILLIGDVVGNSGCCFLQERLPQLKRTHHVDLTIVNGENGKWIFADATWCSRNSYSVDKEWEYQGYSDGYFDLSPEEIAELSNHQIYRVDGLLKDGLYYSLISYRWSRGNWYFDLAAVKK